MFAEILWLDSRDPARNATLEALGQKAVLGLEVTDAEYAQACAAGNVDPQHTGQRGDLSAIEVVTSVLRGRAAAATSAPDLDSLGSMAVLEIAMDIIAQARAFEGEVLRRIELIGIADRFEHGGWPGVRALPTREHPWFESAGATETNQLAAIAAAVMDRSLSLAAKVQLLKLWLVTGEEPSGYRDRVVAERLEMIEALERGEITINVVADGKLAVVKSTHRAGVGLGYHRAPAVLAYNPQFSFKGGEPHGKYTLAQFTDDYVDLGQVFAELNELECAARGIERTKLKNTWAGSPVVGGSPKGESSALQFSQVFAVMTRHLR